MIKGSRDLKANVVSGHTDDVSVAQIPRAGDSGAIDRGAVGGAEIFENPPGRILVDFGVPATDVAIGQRDLAVCVTADDGDLGVQHNSFTGGAH